MGLGFLVISLVALVQFGPAPILPQKMSVEQSTMQDLAEIPEAPNWNGNFTSCEIALNAGSLGTEFSHWTLLLIRTTLNAL